MDWVLMILLYLMWWLAPVIIIIGFIFYFIKRRGRRIPLSENKHWYWQLALSKEDGISQWFLLLSVFFFGLTLLAWNRDLHDILDWRTIIFLTSVVGFVITYYFKTISTLIFSLIGIAGWWFARVLQVVTDNGLASSYIPAGLIFIALFYYVFGHYHEKELKYKRFALVYMILGIILVTGALFIFSSKAGLVLLSEITKGESFINSWQLTIFFIFFIAVLAGLTLYSVSRKLLLSSEAVAVFIIAFIFGITAFFPLQTVMSGGSTYFFFDFSNQLSSEGIVWAIVFNLILFGELLGLIFSGYKRREEWLINIGTFFLFILIIVKYFDWFFTFMDKSLFFISAGILLFAVGWFMEKGRRYVIINIKLGQQKI